MRCQQSPLLEGGCVEVDGQGCAEDDAGCEQGQEVVIQPAQVQLLAVEPKVAGCPVGDGKEQEGCVVVDMGAWPWEDALAEERNAGMSLASVEV